MENESQPPGPDVPRYVVWLVVGLAFMGYGVGASYAMYTAPPPGGIGPLPLSFALFCAVTGLYIFIAVLLNLWLPKPRVNQMRHHRKISGALFVALIIAAVVVGLRFPRKSTEIASTGQSASSERSATRSIPKRKAAVSTLRPRHSNRPVAALSSASATITVHGHVLLNITPAKLDSVCNGYTSLKCEQIMNGYEGRWVRWRGMVDDVNDDPGVMLLMPSPNNDEFVSVDFEESQRDEVTHLRVGDEITVTWENRNAGHT